MFGGKYKILRSMNTAGTVTLAQNTENGRQYVLKELAEESTAIYRRISELPPQENLMQVHEILRQDGHNVAVCGYAEGKPLDELLESGRVFPIAEIRRITMQLCKALEHLHRHGIIHRDVNPKNIILDEKLHLTLIDYGISRLFTGNREQDTTLYGTEGFAPPEQYGFRETRFTADIYAVGMVLKLLLNSCPNCSPTQEILLRKIAAKCTRFVPEKRLRSAASVRRAVSCSAWLVPIGITTAFTAACAGVIAAVLMLKNPLFTKPDSVSSASSEPFHPNGTGSSDTITVTTEKNERGYYEDIFEYRFYDDPTVHGEWKFCNTIPIETLNTPLAASDIKNLEYGCGNIFSRLRFGGSGEVLCILANGEEMPRRACWTNGFLICEYVEATAAQPLFETTIDGEEFLFVTLKTGDFFRENKVYYYEVYTRAE